MKIKHLLLLLPVALFMLSCTGGTTGKHSKPSNNIDSVSYAIGMLQGNGLKNNLERQKIELNNEMVLAGIYDALGKDTLAKLFNAENASAVVRTFFDNKEKIRKAENLENGRKFLAENASKSGVQTTASGLQYKVESEGNGVQPHVYDTVVVHYRGKLIDGKEFESSYNNGQPAKFCLNGVIKGWTEGLQLMKEGGKATFYIPTELAYGEFVYPGSGIEPNMPLIFDLELIKVIPGKPTK